MVTIAHLSDLEIDEILHENIIVQEVDGWTIAYGKRNNRVVGIRRDCSLPDI